MKESTQALASIPREEYERVFDAPWQAQAFALVIRLHRSGFFTWEKWVSTFSAHVARSPQRSGESVNDAYYRQWIDALEQIAIDSELIAPGDTQIRAEVWKSAYVNTPHGQAVALANAFCPPQGMHEAKPRGEALAIFSGVRVQELG